MVSIKSASAKNEQQFIFRRLIIHPLFVISFLLSISTITSIAFLTKNIPLEIPLFYGLPEGEEQITTQNMIYLPSLISLTFTIVNIALATLFDHKYPQRVLLITSFVISIFATITTFQIIRLVGSF